MDVRHMPANYQVWFSTDEDDGTLLVACCAIDLDGQMSFPITKRFMPWQDWQDVAAWIWSRVTEVVGEVR
jgi:hypothetical protein